MGIQTIRELIARERNKLMQMVEDDVERDLIDKQIHLLEDLQANLRLIRTQEQQFHQTVSVPVYSPPRKSRSSSNKQSA